MFIFATIMLLLSILWFSLVMIREPRTLWSGASFLFLLLQSAIWLMAVLFMNSERIMANRLMMLLLTLALLVVMVLIAVFPVAFIGVFFWEGIKNIRREGLRPANALSLLFAAGLVIYTLV